MSNVVSTQVALESNNPINLRDHITLLKGTSLVNITTLTTVKLTGGRKNEQQGRVQKITITPALVFNDINTSTYQNKVNRELAKEGKEPDFTVGEAAWGYKTIEAGIKEYTTKDEVTDRYLQYIQNGKPRSIYLLDGVPVSKNDIEGLPAPRKPSGQGGLENQVQLRIVKLQNIVRLAIKGQKLVGAFYYE